MILFLLEKYSYEIRYSSNSCRQRLLAVFLCCDCTALAVRNWLVADVSAVGLVEKSTLKSSPCLI